MNAFGLDRNYTVAAMLHNDKHVVKMNIEYCQLMSTAHRVLDGEEYYDKTKNNRRIKRRGWMMFIWRTHSTKHLISITRQTSGCDPLWVITYGCMVCGVAAEEYTHRYGKVHASWEKLHNELAMPPKNILMLFPRNTIVANAR